MRKLAVTVEGYTYEIDIPVISAGQTEITLSVNGEDVTISALDMERSPVGIGRFLVAGRPYEVDVDPAGRWVRSQLGIHALEVQDLETAGARPAMGDGRILAPIPGQVTIVMVAEGDDVEIGQPLMILEAMKMENEIRTPRAGRVSVVNVQPGQKVGLAEVLIEIE